MPVIDASIAVKWFVDEPDSLRAQQLLTAHTCGRDPLVAPDLLVYEVSNALLHNPTFSSGDVQRAVAQLYDLQLELVAPSAEIVIATIALASAKRLTFYDALYVELARHFSLPLYTADRKLLANLRELPHITLL